MFQMNPRTMIRFNNNTGRQTKYCAGFGCTKPTTGGKPFCVNHVEDNPYVQGVLKTIDDRADEITKIGKRGTRAIDIDGSAAQEALTYLKVYGKCTIKRLAKDLSHTIFIARHYVIALRRAGLVTTSKNARKILVIEAV